MRLRYAILIPLFGVGSWLGHSALAAPAKAKRKTTVASAKAPQTTLVKDVVPVLNKYCGSCHGPGKETAGIAIHGFKTEGDLVTKRDLFERISHSMRTGHMPPKGLPQPTAAERTAVSAFIDTRFAKLDCDLRDPGRVTMRRLNRIEYNNTIHDLLHVNINPADDFPSDDVGYGFDNIGDVLTISPLLMEKYMAAAEKVARLAILAPEDRKGPVNRFEGEKAKETSGEGVIRPTDRLLVSSGEVRLDYQFPQAGDYVIRARAFQQPAGTEPAKMSLRLDDKELKLIEVTALENAPAVYEFRTSFPAGKHKVSAYFTNDFYDQKAADPKNRDRNLGVDYVEIVGPIDNGMGAVPESHKLVFTCGCKPGQKHTPTCAKTILSSFAKRAFRRPVSGAEVDRLVKYVAMAEKEGESFERGVQLAMQAVLVSPHFLFRIELDADPLKPNVTRALNDYELATRLSYFLWSTMPDAELFKLADEGKLKTPRVTAQQVNRMLKDPKAHALVENFGDQWLTLRTLAAFNPDPKRFPQWNEDLRKSMLKETELFFEGVMKEDRSILEFLDADYTYVDERLAALYGIPGVSGKEFRRVKLDNADRGGLLGQASILAITSNPTRTSPVKRGKWVLEQILGTPPPPPPPNVPTLENQAKLTGTLRQRMEQHRTNPLCNSCHQQMDAIGFGLENFDAIGAWRTADAEGKIDPAGTLPGGKSFEGPAGLKKILKSQDEQFVKNFTERLLTYALGRGVERYDRCNLDAMTRKIESNDYRFTMVVHEIVKSDAFRMRRGDNGGR